MIDIELRIRNYRCFGDEPARFRITDGFTALVGVNNSGKSSLLRLLYEIRNLFGQLSTPQQDTTQNLLRGNPATGLWSPVILPGERIHRAGTDRDIEIQIIVYDGPDGRYSYKNDQVIVDLVYKRSGWTEATIRTESGDVLGHSANPLGPNILDIVPFTSAMAELAQTMYVGPFRNAINIGGGSYYDIHAGTAFIDTFSSYKSGPDPTANEAIFKLLDDVRRIFGFTSLDINPATPDRQALQLIVDGRSYRLTEQGAGLAHFIVMLTNVLVRRPSFLLIDEPELNLHASLQLDFLETLARYTRHGVIFATHSLGLARTAADRIYALTKPPGEASEVRQYEESRELVTLLGQLSFEQRPELGFSRVLLVEGKSDLRAIARLLRSYDKEHEVLLLPLHGDEFIRGDVEHELSELKRLGGDIKYLIDSERESEGAPLAKSRQEFVDLCVRLNIDGHVLERRALENYFTQDAVKRALGEAFTVPEPYEKKGWPKAQNWRIADVMTKADLDDTDLGHYLETV